MSTVSFGPGRTGATLDSRAVLGGKGFGLVAMSRMGLPVPSGFVLPVPDGRALLFEEADTMADVRAALGSLEADTGLGLGSLDRPLLLAVRSGAAQSMPGMMDTILNLGMTLPVLEAMPSEKLDWAWECRARLVASFGSAVYGVPQDAFEETRDEWVADGYSGGHPGSTQLLAQRYERLLAAHGHSLPDDAQEQLRLAMQAVLLSWMSPRAMAWRQRRGLDDAGGTACTVQRMVFGNAPDGGATGICVTTRPDGLPGLHGEWLPNAQGEDLASGSGIHHPLPVTPAAGKSGFSLQERNPRLTSRLFALARTLENAFGIPQEFEWTMEGDELFVLQTRAMAKVPKPAEAPASSMCP